MYRDTTDVDHETYYYTSGNWTHRNSNKKFKEKFGSHTRKTFNKATTKGSYTWNITHNTESTAGRNLKPERWRSLLVQDEKYQGEKTHDKRRRRRRRQQQQQQQQQQCILLASYVVILHFRQQLQSKVPLL
jgi:hypothetical protein